MSFFGKKKEEVKLPDLPEAKIPPFSQNLESDDDYLDERHILPAFPDSPSHNKFSQAAIKSAVGEPGMVGMSIPPKNIRVVEMEEWNPSNYGFEREQKEIPDFGRNIPHPPVEQIQQRASVNKTADIFVRLDKFHSAKKSLEEIREKLDEIDNMIRKIRETKLREDQELSLWERDLVNVKSRIQEITENIFEKVE